MSVSLRLEGSPPALGRLVTHLRAPRAPPSLWAAGVELARQCGVSKTVEFADGCRGRMRIYRTVRSATPASVHLKLWLTVPNASPLYIVAIGGDGGFTLPGGSDRELGPVRLFTVTAAFRLGTYDFSSRMLDPVSGAMLSEDLNSFVVQ